MVFNLTGLRPLDSNDTLDTTGLTRLDTSGLTAIEGAAPGRLKTAGSSLARGFGTIVAGMPKALALLGVPDSTVFRNLDRIDRGQGFVAFRSFGPMADAPDPMSIIYRQYQAADSVERDRIRARLTQDVEERLNSGVYRAGESVDNFFRETFPVNPAFQDEFWSSKLPQGLGSAGGFVLASLVGRGALGRGVAGTYGVPATLGAATNKIDQFEQALDSGSDIATALQAAELGTIIGTTEAVPVGNLLNRLDRVGGGQVKRYLVRVVQQGTEEAIQEAFAGIMNAAVSQRLYDPERGIWTTERLEEGAVGFTTGALLETLFTLALPGRRRGASTGSAQQTETGVSETAVSEDASGDVETVESIMESAKARLTELEATPNPDEQMIEEMDFLRENATRPTVLADAYGVRLVPTLGEREAAVAETPPLSEADRASPLPDDLIAEGKAVVQDALGADSANKILEAAEFPTTGTDIVLSGRDGGEQTATVVDAFDDGPGSLAGAKLQLADGRTVAETFESLRGRVRPLEETDAQPEPAETQPSTGDQARQAAPAPRQAAEPAEKLDTTGLRALGGAGRAISANLRDRLWAEYRGEATAIDPLVKRARAELPGMSREQFEQWIENPPISEVERETFRGQEITDADLQQVRGRAQPVPGERASASGVVLPEVSRGAYEADQAEVRGSDARAEDEGQRTVDRRTLPTERETDSQTLQEMRRSEDGDAPRGLRQASGSDVAVPTVPPAAASERGVTDAEPALTLRGERIDDEWIRFAPESQTRAIPRDDMPQIKAEHRGALANFLKARGIEGNEETVAANTLKPTQAEFSEKKVQKAKDFEGGDRAILVSSDGHILDGHHQFMAAVDDGKDIRIIRLDAPIDDLLTVVPEFPSAEGGNGLQAPATRTVAELPDSDVSLTERESSQNVTIEPSEGTTDGLQGTISERDARTGATDVQPSAPDRGARDTRGVENERSAGSVRRTDGGRTETIERTPTGAVRDRSRRRGSIPVNQVREPDDRTTTEQSAESVDRQRPIDRSAEDDDQTVNAPGLDRARLQEIANLTGPIAEQAQRAITELDAGDTQSAMKTVSGMQSMAEGTAKRKITRILLDSGLLDRPRQLGNSEEFSLTDEASDQFNAVMSDLNQRLEQVGLSGQFSVRLSEVIRDKEGAIIPGARGRRYQRLIEIATTTQDKRWTLDHEIIHALKSLGVIRTSEWSSLKRKALADEPLMTMIRQRYKKQKLSEEKLIEEAVADMHANWNSGKFRARGFFGRAMERINDFLEAVGNAFRGNGFQSAGDIFRRISTGAVGTRSTTEPIIEGEPAFALSGAKFDPIRARKAVARLKAKQAEAPGPVNGEKPVFRDGFANVDERLIDIVRQKIQDRFIDLRVLQQSQDKIPDAMNAYVAEELYHGKAEFAIEEARTQSMQPLIEAVRDAELTVDQADDYLYARHAKERNKRVAEINPLFEDGGGSGMTDAEADAVLKQYADNPKVQRIGQLADDVTRKHRNLLVSSGLEKAETIEAWEAMYEHYVPLKGRPGDAPQRTQPGRGRGFDVRGRTKAATGRRSRAESVVANLLAQYETDIIRSQKAEVGRALLRFVQAHPDTSLWEVDKVEYAGSINPNTGLVQYRPSRVFQMADNAMVVKVDGVDHHIVFHGNRGARIASAMKNLGAANAGSFVRAFASVNRILAAVNTAFNPEFVVTNLVRDLQTAGINLAGTEADGVKGRIIKDVGSAWRGIRRSQKDKKPTEWSKHFDDFMKAGAKTGWIDAHSDVDRLHQTLEKEIRSHERSGKNPIALMRKLAKFVEAENVAVENAVRLSAFVHARNLGLSDMQAASLAKNLTVNFNRKGEWGPIANSFYLFYNASIQGSVRMLHALRSPKVRAIAGGIVVFAAVLDMMNRIVGGDDEDEIPRYDKIPPWVKERNLVVMNPWSEEGYFKLPLPWGYNIFHVLGQKIGEASSAAMGYKSDYSALDSATTVLSALAGAFNPLGSEATLGQFLSPTAGDPILALEQNVDWSGRKIRPGENPFEKAPSPDSQKYWNSTSDIAKWVTEKLNALTGGSEVRPGAIDVSPTTLEYLYEFASGGAGRFINNVIDAPIKQLVDGEIETFRIPFVRKIYGDVGARATQEKFYQNLEQVYYAQQEYRLAIEKKDARMRARVQREQRPYLRARLLAKETERRLRLLRERRNSLRVQPGSAARRELKRTEKRMEQVMLEFNKRIHRLQQ